jgi:hypothetical protein
VQRSEVNPEHWELDKLKNSCYPQHYVEHSRVFASQCRTDARDLQGHVYDVSLHAANYQDVRCFDARKHATGM